jgi:hypothetical protein
VKGGVLSYKHDNTIYSVGMGNNGTYKQKDLDQTARSNTQATLWMTDFFVGLVVRKLHHLHSMFGTCPFLAVSQKHRLLRLQHCGQLQKWLCDYNRKRLTFIVVVN